MKHLKDILNEGLLSDMEDTIARGEDDTNDAILSMLFSKNLEQRRKAFDMLRIIVESYHPKQQKTTAKMKDSDSYFIQFTKSFKIKNGDVSDELMHFISYIHICKRSGPYGYRTTLINASDERYGCNINDYIERWQYTRSNFTPQSKGCMLYEVPEELNNLFKRIQMEAHDHR